MTTSITVSVGRWSTLLAALIDYRPHRPNPGDYEGPCPSILLGDDADQPLAAIAALRPDQIALVDPFMAGRRRGP